MRHIRGLIPFLLCCASLSWAQSAFIRRIDLFGGYNYTHGEFTGLTNDRSTNSLNGWDGAVTLKANRWLSWTGDVAGYYAKESCYGGTPSDCLVLKSRARTFLFGPRVSLLLPRITPFAHLLIGEAEVSQSDEFKGHFFPPGRFQSNTSFALAAGGGADVHLSRHLALRSQLDYLHTGFNVIDNQQQGLWTHNSIRISTGVVFRF